MFSISRGNSRAPEFFFTVRTLFRSLLCLVFPRVDRIRQFFFCSGLFRLLLEMLLPHSTMQLKESHPASEKEILGFPYHNTMLADLALYRVHHSTRRHEVTRVGPPAYLRPSPACPSQFFSPPRLPPDATTTNGEGTGNTATTTRDPRREDVIKDSASRSIYY